MKKMILIVGIIIMLFVSNFPFGTIGTQNQSNIIYVDDDNIEGPWDGSLDYPFQYIQEAIDYVSEGDLIIVRSGVYYENVVINKSISLFGQFHDNTIIHGVNTSSVVTIDVSDVTISGFTIENASKDGNNDYCITVNYKNGENTIKDNILRDFTAAAIVCWHSSNYNKILGNQIILDAEDLSGIYLYHCIGSLIQYNHICCEWTEDSQYYHGVGIELFNSYLINIKNNSLNNLSSGIALYETLKCDITSNQISNSNSGINLYYSSSYNTISKNKILLDYSGYGLSFDTSTANNISFNNIGYARIGILFHDSSDNTIYKNNLIGDNIDARFYTNKLTPNIWKQNYWGKMRTFPKFIIGRIGDFDSDIYWFNVDWHPAGEPYDI